MAGNKIKFEGPVIELEKFVNPRLMHRAIKTEIRKAVIKNSLVLIRLLKKEIRGRNLTENSPLTLSFRKNSIPLLDERNLLSAMGFALKSSFESEVGYVLSTQSTGGKAGNKASISIQKLVELTHKGFVIDVTPAMRAAMIAELRKSKKRKAKKALKSFNAIDRRGKATYVVPPRPFMEKVFNRRSTSKILRTNWKEALERAYKRQGARGGEHKER